MICSRVLIPTSEGKMKVVYKDSPEYKEIQEREWESLRKERMDRIPSSFDEVAKKWGSFPKYFKWLKKLEENERQIQQCLHLMPQWKRNRILNIEKGLIHYKKTGDFNRLYKKIKFCVDYWAGYYSRRYSNFWLSREDFEEVFWINVKQAADSCYIGVFNKDNWFDRLGYSHGYFETDDGIYFYPAIKKAQRPWHRYTSVKARNTTG